MKVKEISYWLIPGEPEKSLLSKIISGLAERFDAPKFEPHLTLYSGATDDLTLVDEIIAGSTVGISEVVLRSTGIEHSEKFTKAMFVGFEVNGTLARISNELKRLSASPADYRLEPHLSLIYADLSNEVKGALAREIQVPPLTRFNSVQAVRTTADTRTKRDVETWRVLAQTFLEVERS